MERLGSNAARGARSRREEQIVGTERNVSTRRRTTRAPERRTGGRARWSWPAIAVSAGALLALTVTPALSAAAPKASRAHVKSHVRYVSGRLNASGYTVVAVGYNGKIAASKARSFRIAAPDSKVTLQLINVHGKYVGPVVFGGSSKRVITGIKVVKAGVNVGTVDVVASKGYAHVARRLASKNLDKTRWAYAKHGVPIGNGRNLGLVKSKSKGGGTGAGQDQAHVGIPNEFDIAVPGTLVLRALAPAAKAKGASVSAVRSGASREALARAATNSQPPPSGGGSPSSGTQPSNCTPTQGSAPPPGCPPPGEGGPKPGEGGPKPSSISPWMSQMFLSMDETVNVDAAGVTQAEIDSTLQAKLNLKFLNASVNPAELELVEFNCNGLSFCSQGGTGQAQLEGLPLSAGTPNTGGAYQTIPFPSGSLDTATGFGEIVGPAVPKGLLGTDAGGGHEFSLNPNATSAQIGSGDVVTLLVTHKGVTTQIPTTIDFVFNTVPAIASYSDTAGNSGAITYPDTSHLGTQKNPIKVAAGPNGDVVVTFTVLRPQRPGVAGAGEPAFMDIGHLGYAIDYVNNEPHPTTVGGSLPPECPTTSYSNPSSTLSAYEGGAGKFSPPSEDGWMVDSANDQPASSANTVSFTIDLTKCLASKGTTSFPIGQPVQFDLSANSQSSADHANQTFMLERTS